MSVPRTGPAAVQALDQARLTIVRGGFIAIMGPSGSGKSTMMHAMAGQDTDDAGSVRIDALELVGLSERGRTVLRRTRTGLVFQTYSLVPARTAAENIEFPMRLEAISHA